MNNKKEEEYLTSRNKRNRAITTLTPEQHDALEWLTAIRHTMHANPVAFIKADVPNHAIIAQYIFDGPENLSINQHLDNVGLPRIVFPVDIYRVLLCDTVSRSNFQTDYEYLLMFSKNLDRDLITIEALNSAIESYLRWIDTAHHTEYCPYGKYRKQINKKMKTEETLTMIQQQTVMMDIDWYRQGDFPVVPKIETMATKRPATIKQRLFVDLDGTLATFRALHEIDQLGLPGYYEGLLPHWNVVYAIRDIIKYHPAELDVYVISSAIAIHEKNGWLNQYIPELDAAHRIYCPYGIDRTIKVPGGLYSDDFLLDDSTRNLAQWEPPARAVKLLNGLNHLTRSPWPGDCLRYDRSSHDIRDILLGIMKQGGHVRDEF